jgi:hypothetical protein
MKPHPRRRRPGSDVILPEAMVDHLDKMADDVLKAIAAQLCEHAEATGTKPPGYNRSHLRQIVRAIGRRSLADTGRDFPTDAFGER